MSRRGDQVDFPSFLEAGAQQHSLRSHVARVGVRAHRLKTEVPKTVVDSGGNCLSSVSITPIGRTQPIAERRLSAAVPAATVGTDTADQAVVLLQRDSKPSRPRR
jgi:hypothetical protein